ncbi:alpha/beta hydrolase [Croceibacter atlanticus]|uniref:alpha/beta fold hydrolase n=1 Tax=Croceibacter atlanticus TaxID=313588 RepID=UPI002E0EE227|nr:alpha/beta hydrolase [Croceibacter atlanticus]
MKNFILKILGFIINSTAPVFPSWNREFSFKLLCRVKRVGITEKGEAFFKKSIKHNFEINNQNVVLHKWGTGKKRLFFVHGWMSNSQRWQPYIDQLDLTEYTAYALDAQGHGLSDGNALNFEIYRKAIAASEKHIGHIHTMVCHSLGSMVTAYAFLVNTNLNVSSYVIMGAPSGMDAIFTYFKVMLGLSTKSIQNLLIKVNEVLKLPADRVTMAQFFKLIDKPILVIHETQDKVTPILPIQEGVKQNPDIKTFYTEGLGHNLESDIVVNAVLERIKLINKEPQETY